MPDGQLSEHAEFGEPLRAWRNGDSVVLEGDLDMATAPIVDAVIGTVEGRLVLEMAQTSFIDSCGLRTLIEAARCRPVVLRDPKPEVRRLLEITGTIDMFTIE